MTILDSVLKSRDITLPTKVYIVKAMDFSQWSCMAVESWTVRGKNAKELMPSHCGAGEDS